MGNNREGNNNMKIQTWRAAVSAAAICVAAVALPSWAADRTISANYVLTTDETVDGVLTVDAGVTVDLNGHNLTVGALASTALATTNDIAVGYAGLTYLETDGRQYVSLSDYSLASTDRVEMCVRFLSPAPTEQFLFGSRAAALSRAFNLYVNKLACRIDYDNTQPWFGQTLNTTDDYTIVMDGGNHSFYVLSDGVYIKPAVAMTNTTFEAVNPFSLFTLNSSSLGAKVRFYWFRAYGSDGSLKCNAVPAYDKNAGVIGVYDLVSGNFYGNRGTGAFTAKGESRIVNTIEGYSRLSYLDTDGASYASLADYTPAENDRVEMDVRFLATKNQFLFGSRQATLNRAFNLYLNNNNPRIDYSNKQPSFGQALNTTDDYVIVMDGKNLSFTVNYPGGLAVKTVAISGASSFTPVSPFYLFTVNTAGAANANYAKVRFYRFKVYGSDGTLKSDVVPAKRASDGAIGVYDRAAKAFYAKSGSGNFTAVGAVETKLSNVVEPAEVHVNVTANTVVTNDVVRMEENVKLVKDGAGSLVAAMKSQRYSGGTLVTDGTLLCGGNGTDLIFGEDRSVITVSTNGETRSTLEMNGKLSFANYSFVMNGGRIVNSVDPGTGGNLNQNATIASLSLTADSSFIIGTRAPYGMVQLENVNSGSWGVANASLDLGGHTLTVDCAETFVTRGLTTSGGEAGRILVTGSFGISFYPPESDMSNATLIMDGMSKLRVLGSNRAIPTVKDYIVNTTASDELTTVTFFGPVVVLGTFQPNTDRFYGCKLMSGATLDLSGRTTPLDVRSANNVSAGASARNIQFEDGATIRVKLGNTSLGNPIVKWSNTDDKPSNWDDLTFELASRPSGGYLVKKENGLYIRRGFLVIVK